MRPSFILRQYNANGQCIDHSCWISNDKFDLHVLMFDVLITGCVRFEIIER